MLGKCYIAFVRNFIDILAEHHANSKMQILRGLNRRRLSGLASEASQRGAQNEARLMVVDGGGTSGKGEDYASTSDEGNARQPGAGPKSLLTFYSEVMQRKKKMTITRPTVMEAINFCIY